MICNRSPSFSSLSGLELLRNSPVSPTYPLFDRLRRTPSPFHGSAEMKSDILDILDAAIEISSSREGTARSWKININGAPRQ
ncbi:hypothetical protein IV203_002812 [Nitzschia inconspicua]|uniref:Uncharacterized protein n=1 Tax=Nitzschia inconspicua TaxID=303405 RepID=A0A9K3PN35_9STRA|nr:hypothetical protein IV203_002812 [Nitzschia inconspicua]